MSANGMNELKGKRRVCVIGAGTAGLCTIRHCLAQGMDVVAYEQGAEIGGTWVYNNNLPQQPNEKVHSSLYENLRTNLPKEIMGFPDFVYPDTCKESFVDAAEVLKFLQAYADKYKLHAQIKLQTEVMRVRPRKDEWEVYVRDLTTGNKSKPEYFDFVFVCNGHYSEPTMPQIEGMDVYKGQQMHSHFYRNANLFKDAKVLVIGAGPSGMDITYQLSKTTAHVYLSHHLKQTLNTDFMKTITQKPDVERFTETGAIFKDGSVEEFSYIIFCTGYKYSFPCISCDCGVRVIENWVHPLWKHVIAINNPTMAFIGLPFTIIPALSFDLQVRFALKYFTGEKELPSTVEMLADMDKDIAIRTEKGWSKKLAHQMRELQFDYYDDLAATADIAKIKPVYAKIMKECMGKYIFNFESFRNYCYRIIDDDNYEKFPLN